MTDATEYQKLREAIFELKSDIERMAERQAEMIEDVKKIKEAIYNPDEGLYARIKSLEAWKDSTQRVMWVVTTTVVGLLTATIYKFFVS